MNDIIKILKYLQSLIEKILLLVEKFQELQPKQQILTCVFVALIGIFFLLLVLLFLILKFKKFQINRKILGVWYDQYDHKEKQQNHITLLRIKYLHFINEYYVYGKDWIINNNQYKYDGKWESTVIKYFKPNQLRYLFDADYKNNESDVNVGHTILKFDQNNYSSYEGHFVNKIGEEMIFEHSSITGHKIKSIRQKRLFKNEKYKELIQEIINQKKSESN
ncbi:MAG: hypothetical protein ISS81_10725 [Candidatus Marinimicrobia bacterium]|nr:hypothetical protein [Candidatus Neomarinimicrobiota bacterium]